MKNNKSSTSTKNLDELGKCLNLSEYQLKEIELRSKLLSKIIDTVKKRNIKHLELAKLSGISRTRITALMNRNSLHVSTSVMIKLLFVLGYAVNVKIRKIAA